MFSRLNVGIMRLCAWSSDDGPVEDDDASWFPPIFDGDPLWFDPMYCPLPDGFIDDLFDQLPDSTRYHLIKHLADVKTHLPQRQTSTHNNPQDQSVSSPKLQRVILCNITRIGKQFFSEGGHDLNHTLLLWRLICQRHFGNLVELDLALSDHVNWLDDSQQSPLNKLNSLAPLILNSLPRLKSLKFPEKNYCRPDPLFFSLPGLFPAGQRSCHLEKLCLTRLALKKVDLKYLALDSNYIFPSLTRLDLSYQCFDEHTVVDGDGDCDDVHSTMHYLLQWIEKNMPKLAHLDLSECDLTTAGISIDLANSPILSRLESLDLSGNRTVEAEGWQALFSSPQFTNSQDQDCSEDSSGRNTHHTAKLKTLKLNSNQSIKSVIPLLTQDCPYLTNLTTLSLDCCALNDSSIQSLCESKWIRGLESVSLQLNEILTSDSVRMIADCEGMRNLTCLDFGCLSDQFYVDLLHHITQSQHVSKLTKIEIDFVDFEYDKSAVQVLLDFFHSPKAAALTTLSLDCNNIPHSTLRSIVLSPMLSNLEIVRFSNLSLNNDQNEWFNAFVSSPNRHKLHTLFLYDSNLTDSNVLSISQSPHLSNLRDLNLHNNPDLTDDSMKHFAQSEGLQLNKLSLTFHPLLTPLSLHHLAQSPQFVSSLGLLDVRGCHLIGKEDRDILTKSGWFDGKITC